MRADESAEDLETKISSLPTVGPVTVSRETLEISNGAFTGYKWMITFNSLSGDIPLMTYSLTPTGYELYGKDMSFTLKEEVKGTFLPRVSEITGLTSGKQYTAQIFAHNL